MVGGTYCTAAGIPFRYTGQRLDPETALYYYRARYYSSAYGRFNQNDSVGYRDDFNLYIYAGNDPTDRSDPSGMYDKRIWNANHTAVTIVVPVQINDAYGGPLAISNSAIASRAHQDFSGRYTVAGKAVQVNVVVQFVSGHAPNENTLNYIMTGPGRDNAPGSNTIEAATTSGAGEISHEIGHLLGASDHYHDVPRAIGAESVPDNGWAGNLMADSSVTTAPNPVPGSVDQRNMNEIFQKEDSQKAGQSNGGHAPWSIDNGTVTGERCTGRFDCK